MVGSLKHVAACELISVLGEPPDATYVFKHALVQDAAYATMVRSNRQQLHRRIADALMAGSPETVETQPELMTRGRVCERACIDVYLPGFLMLPSAARIRRRCSVDGLSRSLLGYLKADHSPYAVFRIFDFWAALRRLRADVVPMSWSLISPSLGKVTIN